MTTTQTRVQRAALTRYFVRSTLGVLLVSTLVMVALTAGGALLARWRSWDVATGDMDMPLVLGVEADRDGVLITFSFGLIAVAVGFAAVAAVLAQAGTTRVLVANGATRRAIWSALLTTAAVCVAYVLALAVAVRLVLGGRADVGELALQALQASGLLAVLMALGLVVVALFLRWPWWVGVSLLTLLGVGSMVAAAVGSTLGSPGADLAFPGSELVLALALAAVSWLLARRIPVR